MTIPGSKAGRVLRNRTSGERDASQPQVRDQTEPVFPQRDQHIEFRGGGLATLEPAISVHGIVHDRDSGQPVGAATVTAVAAGGEVVASTVSDPDGRYQVTGIDADTVTLVVVAPGADPRAQEVPLGRGTDFRVDLALDTYSTLTGRVTADGHPVENLRLALCAPDGWTEATAVTDHDGTYRFDRVKAGQYVLASVTGPGRTVVLAQDATSADLELASGA